MTPGRRWFATSPALPAEEGEVVTGQRPKGGHLAQCVWPGSLLPKATHCPPRLPAIIPSTTAAIFGLQGVGPKALPLFRGANRNPASRAGLPAFWKKRSIADGAAPLAEALLASQSASPHLDSTASVPLPYLWFARRGISSMKHRPLKQTPPDKLVEEQVLTLKPEV